jgi:nickel-dependent lactate racemase
MPETSVPWGSSSLEISLPPHWRLQQIAEPDLRPAAPDWADHLARALNQADGGTSLADLLTAQRNGRIVIVVEDLTRHSPLAEIIPIILREVRHAGIDDARIEIVFANGMHPPLTPEQAAAKLGESDLQIRWRCNQYDSDTHHISLGVCNGVEMQVDRGIADADIRIIVSSVSPHLQAGFGGAYKMFFPGCAHIDTIRALHRLGIDRRPTQLVGTDVTENPMRRVIDAAGKLLDKRHGRSFAVQYILDADNLPSFIAAGEVLTTHRMMAKQCSVACGVMIPQPADVLITNAHPRDYDLWQSFKCIANTRWAARPNGVVICLARCEAGLNGMWVPPWPLSPLWTRRLVRWVGADSLGMLVTRAVPRLAGDAAFFVRMALRTIHRNPILMVSPALCDAGFRFPGIELFSSVDEAVAGADALLGGGEHRAVIFPSGGTTFPVPTGASGETL